MPDRPPSGWKIDLFKKAITDEIDALRTQSQQACSETVNASFMVSGSLPGRSPPRLRRLFRRPLKGRQRSAQLFV